MNAPKNTATTCREMSNYLFAPPSENVKLSVCPYVGKCQTIWMPLRRKCQTICLPLRRKMSNYLVAPPSVRMSNYQFALHRKMSNYLFAHPSENVKRSVCPMRRKMSIVGYALELMSRKKMHMCRNFGGAFKQITYIWPELVRVPTARKT